MNNLPIICYDFETAGKIGYDPYICYPIQVAAIVIDSRKLEPIPGATFSSMMCPDIKEEEWATAEEDWKGALDVNKKRVADIKAAPKEAEVWKAFVGFVKKYNYKGNQFNAPVSAGQNIDRFDCIIADRLCRKHKTILSENKPLLFNQLISIDLKNILFMWFEGNNELKNYKMDTLRPYLGIPEEGAHDALVDVQQVGEVICRFLKMHRKIFPNLLLKGAFSRGKNNDTEQG